MNTGLVFSFFFFLCLFSVFIGTSSRKRHYRHHYHHRSSTSTSTTASATVRRDHKYFQHDMISQRSDPQKTCYDFLLYSNADQVPSQSEINSLYSKRAAKRIPTSCRNIEEVSKLCCITIKTLFQNGANTFKCYLSTFQLTRMDVKKLSTVAVLCTASSPISPSLLTEGDEEAPPPAAIVEVKPDEERAAALSMAPREKGC